MAGKRPHGDEGKKNPGPQEEAPRSGGLSRRQFLGAGAATGALAALGGSPAALAAGHGGGRGSGSRGGGDLVLVNGRIHTMDGSGTVASSVAIQDGRIVSVDRGARGGGGGRVINLRGRTVVPGIIDNHNHIVLMGNRPGHHTPLENAYSIADVQETYARRAGDVPAGEFITTIGGFHFNQFAETRLPTLAELDEAVGDHPAYISVGFAGPTVTNSAGKAWFEERGIPVADDGSIEGGGFGPSPTGEALLALRQELLNPATRRRGAMEAMAYGAGLGVTTHLDQGAFQATGTPADGAAHEDNFTMHLPFLELYREGELGVRLRINFLNLETDPEVPLLTARLQNAFQFFGGDLVRTGAIGEFTAGDPFELFAGTEPSEAWREGTRRVAEAGWRNENHSLSATDFQAIIEGWEEVNSQHD
ncbi:MAG: amidohydrolase family protein, partial [Actinomycetota bacterium]